MKMLGSHRKTVSPWRSHHAAGTTGTNGHVVRIAREVSCQLVVDSDAHSPYDLLDKKSKENVAIGAGLTLSETAEIISLNIDQFLRF